MVHVEYVPLNVMLRKLDLMNETQFVVLYHTLHIGFFMLLDMVCLEKCDINIMHVSLSLTFFRQKLTPWS